MIPRPRRLGRWIGALAALVLAVATGCRAEAPRPDTLPERVTDKEFWQFVTTVSEPNGYFHSENPVSNEMTFQFVIPRLATAARTDGVYLGVGPEQNFTYIAALQPKLAIILDIRRQNLVVHLYYKALFELSADRGEFVSRLFGRPRSANVDSTTTVSELFAVAVATPPDSALFARNLREVERQLTEFHGFPLDESDLGTLFHVAQMFHLAGPTITYNWPRGPGTTRYGQRGMPTYADVMTATDSAGVARGYLADEPRFRVVKSLEERNLIIPVVGDFGGPKALRAIGDYLRSHDAALSAIYVSNVEQYLFQSDAWRRYYRSLSTVPVSASTTFIRSIRPQPAERRSGLRLVSTLSPTQEFLQAYERGKIRSYSDLPKITW